MVEITANNTGYLEIALFNTYNYIHVSNIRIFSRNGRDTSEENTLKRSIGDMRDRLNGGLFCFSFDVTSCAMLNV